MATSHIDDFLNDEVAIIADLDMAVMAAPYPKIWRWYEEGIRKEYSDASEQEYVKARKEFLLSVLDKPRIFHTQFFYDLFEEKARYNIKKQIKKYTDLE
jgi:predicted metal-dependent HD superfamily phosphohydrolase